MNRISQMKRVDPVDALRGFAVVAIVLLYFVEHFIYGVYPEATSRTAELLNQSVWNALFFILAGKSYTVFTLLFEFTFIVQQRNQKTKGGDFGGRFVWRLVILMFFTALNAAFFPGGDVLLLFAVMGFVMIPLCKLSQRNLLLIALLFLIQPIELLECFGIDFISTSLSDTYYPTLKTVIDSGNSWDMVVANAGIGRLASLSWVIDTGWLLQAPGLFILEMILARGDYFSCGAGSWVKTFVGDLIASLLFYAAKASTVDALQITLTMWYNMAFTGMLVSMFVILYRNGVFGRMADGLRFYGRMSLMNYISQSIIGSLMFFPYALGLASTLGIAWSFVVGLGVMSIQIWFYRRWLRTHRQGPLEAVWHRLTWLKWGGCGKDVASVPAWLYGCWTRQVPPGFVHREN